jgi:methyltransferase-like protein
VVGFDLAESSIAAGQKVADALQVTNLNLRVQDMMDYPDSDGPFDYIIAHGFYSWVPEPVREKMWLTLRRLLAPQGIAFVSYNAQPGGHLRTLVRDMMLFHTRGAPDAVTKVKQTQAFLGFLEEGMAGTDQHIQLLKAEVARIRAFLPGHLFHDDIAPTNDAFYIHEFVSRAASHDLSYITDADFPSTSDARMPTATRSALTQIAEDHLLKQVYLDFLQCRRFHQALLCHADVTVNRDPKPEALREFYLGGVISREPDQENAWNSVRGGRMRTSNPVAAAVLDAIGDHWPARWSFEALSVEVQRRSGETREEVDRVMESVLWEAFVTGMINAWAEPAPCVTTISEKPVSSALARYMLEHSDSVTTLLHSTVVVGDSAGRQLIALCDGTRDYATLVRDMFLSPVLMEQEPDEAKRQTLAQSCVSGGLAELVKLALMTG